MPMTNIIQTEKITQWIDGYVDDTFIFTSIQEKKGKTIDPAILAKQLQQNTQEWEILLAATGGKLELSKCFYYILCWDSVAEGVPRPETHDKVGTRASSSINPHTGIRRKDKPLSITLIAVQHTEPWDSKKTPLETRTNILNNSTKKAMTSHRQLQRCQ
jgi:hypothetical protein